MLQVHRLVTLFCKFYVLASSVHRLTQRGTHRLYIPRLKVSFYVRQNFLILFLWIILNRFCSVFNFVCISEAVSQVNVYIFVGLIAKRVQLKQKLLKYEVIDVVGNWSGAISVAMPRNILFPQHVFLSIV